MLLGLVSAIAGFFKVRIPTDRAVIDNVTFRLHYRVTTAIFFLFCILCTTNSLLGPTIDCIFDVKKHEHVINTYCWIMSTFTSKELENSKFEIGGHIAHPGVGPVVLEDEENKRYHKYYQWVPFVLFLQGLLFYAPHYVWKNWEGGKVRMISDGLRGALAETRETYTESQTRLVKYIAESVSLHNMYGIGYFFCEILNFTNVILNFFLIDKMLGGMFLSYGPEVIAHRGDDHDNIAMSKVFPRVTKCTFSTYGPSGSLQTHDSMCVLALNILNEKIYLFLWFWLVILGIVSFLTLVYSLAVILFPPVRRFILERGFKFRNDHAAETVVTRTSMADFLLLHLLGQNINMNVFCQILDELSLELSGHKEQPTLPRGNMELTPMYPSKDLLPH